MSMTRDELKQLLIDYQAKRKDSKGNPLYLTSGSANLGFYASEIMKYIPSSSLQYLEASDIPKMFGTTEGIPEYRIPPIIDKITADGIAASRNLITGPTSDNLKNVEATNRKLVDAQNTPKNERSAEQKDLIDKYLKNNPGKTELDIQGYSGNELQKRSEQDTKDVLKRILKTDDAGLEAIRNRYAKELKLSGNLTYTQMSLLAEGNEKFLSVAKKVLSERQGYALSQYTGYTDPVTGKEVMVRNDRLNQLNIGLPGFSDFGRTATRSVVESNNQFANKAGFENVYALLAHTLGIFDANQEPTVESPATDDDIAAASGMSAESALWGLPAGQGALDEESLRRDFIRNKLIQEGSKTGVKLPERILSNGELNPLYQGKPPSLTDPSKIGGGVGAFTGSINSTANLYQDMWDNPERYIDADKFWKAKNSQNETEYNSLVVAQKDIITSDKTFVSDLKREQMLLKNIPRFDGFLKEFGEEYVLAAIVAVTDPELGRKLHRGVGITKLDIRKAELVFRNVNPENVGIISDSLDFYQYRSDEAADAEASAVKIIQPDREKITQGMQELYRSMFHADPTSEELGQLVDDIAGKVISSQYSRTDFDQGAAATKALRGRDVYSQLYGNKPTGLSDEDYNAQFVGTGQKMLGGMQASSAALQAGMRSNDVNVTAAVTNVEQAASRNNSTWLENFYNSVQTISEMT